MGEWLGGQVVRSRQRAWWDPACGSTIRYLSGLVIKGVLSL